MIEQNIIKNSHEKNRTSFQNNKAERQKSDYEEGFVGKTCYICIKKIMLNSLITI